MSTEGRSPAPGDEAPLSRASGDVAVVHVCEALGGGVFEVVRALASATAARGVPTVVVHGRRPQTPARLEDHFHPSVRLVPVPGWGARGLGRALASMLEAGSILRRELARHAGGVVHVHSTYAGVIGRLLPLPAGWRLFYSPHAYAFMNESLPAPVRQLARAAEWVCGRRGTTIAVSRAEGRVAEKIVGRRRVAVVQNGVEPPPRALPGQSRNGAAPFVVTALGRASFQRRPDVFAQLAVVLRPELGAHFVWLGDGPHHEVLARSGVAVTGWLGRDELEGALQRADAVLHLSAFEGMPLALLEAMAAARPVVASDLPPIREVVADAGLLVTSASGAASALRTLYRDAALRDELGEKARSRVERLFTKEAMIERTLAAYGLAGLP